MRAFQDSSPFLGQDPYVATTPGGYYFIESQDESRIAISRLTLTPTLQRYATQVVWSNPRDKQLWAPELHQSEGHWYIYYAASDGHNACHRTHCLRSTDDNPLGPYRYAGQIGPDPDIWAIDLTTFTHNHQRYACWSGWETNTAGPQHLYIAPMSSPTALASHRIKLASPQLPWEQSHAPILEGPQAFTSNGQLTLTYAANASWTQDYATGVLILTGSDPLTPASWSKWPKPLATNCGHGHVIQDTNTFIYHKKLSALHGWSDRVIDTMKVQDLFNYEH